MSYKLKRTKQAFVDRLLTCHEALTFISDETGISASGYELKEWAADGRIHAYVAIPPALEADGVHKIMNGFQNITITIHPEWDSETGSNQKKWAASILTSHPLEANDAILFEAESVEDGAQYRHRNKLDSVLAELPLLFSFEDMAAIIETINDKAGLPDNEPQHPTAWGWKNAQPNPNEGTYIERELARVLIKMKRDGREKPTAKQVARQVDGRVGDKAGGFKYRDENNTLETMTYNALGKKIRALIKENDA